MPTDIIPKGPVPTEAVAEAIKLVEKTGGWLNKVLGKVPEDLVGVLGGDMLRFYRLGNLAKLQDKHERLLENIATDRRTFPSPSVVIPLIEAACDESREELQTLWAALLANAMIDGGQKVRRDYFVALQKMEPQDAVVLAIVGKRPSWHRRDAPDHETIQNLAAQQGVIADVSISIDALAKMDCIRIGTTGDPLITTFGRCLLAACVIE